MTREAAARLVNGWVDDYRMWLKDGGGAAGVHPKAKEALIEKIAAAFAQVVVPPPPPPLRGANAAKKRKTALAQK